MRPFRMIACAVSLASTLAACGRAPSPARTASVGCLQGGVADADSCATGVSFSPAALRADLGALDASGQTLSVAVGQATPSFLVRGATIPLTTTSASITALLDLAAESCNSRHAGCGNSYWLSTPAAERGEHQAGSIVVDLVLEDILGGVMQVLSTQTVPVAFDRPRQQVRLDTGNFAGSLADLKLRVHALTPGVGLSRECHTTVSGTSRGGSSTTICMLVPKTDSMTVHVYGAELRGTYVTP